MHLLMQTNERESLKTVASGIVTERRELAAIIYHAAFDSLGKLYMEDLGL